MEAHLFNTHEELNKVRSSCKGIPALVEKLISVQKGRLEKCIPDIFAQVRGTSNHIATSYLDYESFSIIDMQDSFHLHCYRNMA